MICLVLVSGFDPEWSLGRAYILFYFFFLSLVSGLYGDVVLVVVLELCRCVGVFDFRGAEMDAEVAIGVGYLNFK